MNSNEIMERLALPTVPDLPEALAEIELLRFERELLLSKVRDFELDQRDAGLLQASVDEAAREITRLKAHDEKIKIQLRAEAEKRDRLRLEARTALEARKAAKAQCEQQLAEHQSKLDDLQTRLRAAEAAEAQARETLLQCRKQLADKTEALEHQTREGKEAAEGRRRLAAELASNSKQAREQQTAMKLEMQALKRSNDELEAELRRLESANAELENDMLGILRKMGRQPFSGLAALLPGYRRLRERYGSRLADAGDG